jgi:hypothetical protein
MNLKGEMCYCHACLIWHNINTEVIVLNDMDVVCLRQYPERHILLGYTWDIPEWTVKDNERGL